MKNEKLIKALLETALSKPTIKERDEFISEAIKKMQEENFEKVIEKEGDTVVIGDRYYIEHTECDGVRLEPISVKEAFARTYASVMNSQPSLYGAMDLINIFRNHADELNVGYIAKINHASAYHELSIRGLVKSNCERIENGATYEDICDELGIEYRYSFDEDPVIIARKRDIKEKLFDALDGLEYFMTISGASGFELGELQGAVNTCLEMRWKYCHCDNDDHIIVEPPVVEKLGKRED